MTSLTLDAGTLSRLQNLGDFMEFRDEAGRVLGYFHPAEPASDPESARHRSPFSDEELRRRRQERTGRPLAEILANFSSP
ncbi:MAG TPA: hypothetical protein VFW87_27110 [Pirellulales bacterium]|nr:hypothetical protein [Pirellulales bacterium]